MKSISKVFSFKYKICLIFLTLQTILCNAQGIKADWENPLLVDENKDPQRSSFILFERKEDVVTDKIEQSALYQSLNGIWKFSYTDHFKDRPIDFFETNFNDSKWKTLPVPSNWELQGFGKFRYGHEDKNYTAIRGDYRHRFTIPADWRDKRVFVTVAAAFSARG